MSLLAFSSLGLVPISTALSGALIELNTTALFVGTGFLMTAVVLVSAHNPEARTMSMEQQVVNYHKFKDEI